MGRTAAALDTIWPDTADPKTLVCVKAQCSAAELFDTLFVEPDLQEQLHKQRGDNDFSGTQWVASKDELPGQLYTWEASSSPNKPSHALRYRKVRFESPPAALASKPFQNEETQVLTELVPDQLYVLEAVSSTSAPYGDKFHVFFRYVVRADGPSGSALHLLFYVEFLPSMNRMLRPMVGKAVDAGVRGTFKIFRSVLGSLRPCTDIKEADLPAGPAAVHLPGVTAGEEEEVEEAEEEEEAGAEPRPHHHRHHPGHHARSLTSAHAPGLPRGGAAMPGLLSVLTQQLVYKDQVVLLADLAGAGLHSVTHSDLGAQLLSALVTVWLISLAVAAVRGWQGLCAYTSSGGTAGGLLFLLRLGVCWPLRLVDLPDSTAEVLTSVALVAAINWAVLRAAQLAVRYLSEVNPGLLAALRARGGAGDGAWFDAGPPGEVVGGAPLGGQQGSGGTVAALSGGTAAPAGGAALSPPKGSSAIAAAGTAATAAAGCGGGSAGGSPGRGKEDKKGGKDKSGKGGSSTAAQSSGSATSGKAAAAAAAAAKAKPMRAAPAPKQFSAAQLRQLELGQVTSIGSTKRPASSLPVAPSPSAAGPAAAAQAGSSQRPSLMSMDPAPAMASMADAWAADMPLGLMVSPATTPASSTSSPLTVNTNINHQPSNGAAPSLQVISESAARMSEGSAAAAARAQDAAGGGAAPPLLHTKSLTAPTALTGQGGSLPSAAATPGAAGPSAAGGSSAHGQQLVVPATATAASSFANMFTKEGIDSMAESLRSAFRWDAKQPDADTAPEGGMTSPEQSLSPGSYPPAAKAKARSDAGALISGEAAAAAAAAAAARSGRRAAGASAKSFGGVVTAAAAQQQQQGHPLHAVSAMTMYSAHSELPLLPGLSEDDGDGEEPSVVVEEVFENERFQPFRGWGHMWPGHFLPSDRVGHWSDRQGKPGGSASMVFEQVVPHLPRGWRWLEEEWQVDLESLETDSVDADGWTYALDFYLLKYPPPPGSGKCSLKHFVRRRRWFRTRVRCDDGTDGATRSCDGSAPPEALSGNDEPPEPSDATALTAAGAAAIRRSVTSPPASHLTAEKVMSLAAGFPGGSADEFAVATAAARAEDASSAGVDLRPHAAVLSTSAPTGTAAALEGSPSSSQSGAASPVRGADLPRPRSEGAGLAESALGRKQPESGAAGTGAASAQSPVAATLALLSGSGPGRWPASPGLLSGGGGAAGASSSQRPSESGMVARTPVSGYSPARTSASGVVVGGGGEGEVPRVSGEDFVLSPTTVVTSHDPLGALVEGVQKTGALHARRRSSSTGSLGSAGLTGESGGASAAGSAASAAVPAGTGTAANGSGAAVAAGGLRDAPGSASQGVRDKDAPSSPGGDAGRKGRSGRGAGKERRAACGSDGGSGSGRGSPAAGARKVAAAVGADVGPSPAKGRGSPAGGAAAPPEQPPGGREGGGLVGEEPVVAADLVE